MTNKVRQRIMVLTEFELLELVANFEQFEKDAMIGDCLLRREAERLGESLAAAQYVVLWMNQLAFETYRELWYRASGRV